MPITITKIQRAGNDGNKILPEILRYKSQVCLITTHSLGNASLPDHLEPVTTSYELKERQNHKKSWFEIYKGQILLERFTIQLCMF